MLLCEGWPLLTICMHLDFQQCIRIFVDYRTVAWNVLSLESMQCCLMFSSRIWCAHTFRAKLTRLVYHPHTLLLLHHLKMQGMMVLMERKTLNPSMAGRPSQVHHTWWSSTFLSAVQYSTVIVLVALVPKIQQLGIYVCLRSSKHTFQISLQCCRFKPLLQHYMCG